MRKIITTLILLAAVFVSAQESRTCYVGSFEDALDGEGNFYNPQFYFSYRDNIGESDCSYSVANDPSVSLSDIDLNIFTDYVTVVNNDANVYGGYDPSLLQHLVSVPRVYEGSQAIKLNDTINNKSVASMNFAYQVTQPNISFKYLLIATNPPALSFDNHSPRFIVNLRDQGLNLIDSYCLEITNNHPDFYSTGTTTSDLLYSGWKCMEFEVDTTSVTEVNLQFIVMDDSKGAGFHTAYIDAICDTPCCVDCINVTTPVGTGMIDEKQAEECIYANNTITSTGSAIYHAGTEVVLEEGFEALYGTTDRFYVEGCSGTFVARQAVYTQSTEEDTKPAGTGMFTVYPNPAQSELNIVPNQGLTIKNASLYSPDGKLVLRANGQNTANYRLDISSIANGLYLLSVETNDGNITTTRIVKN